MNDNKAITENTDRKSRPRVMIAAASSGSGKTTVTCALLSALNGRGYEPAAFKCGPDYIDPMFHRTVLGIDSLNLDTYLASGDEIRSTLIRYGADISVIEGVMGIYDGVGTDSDAGSSYEAAAITNTPIILVVGASSVGRTIVSVIKGIIADDTKHLIKGIILNRISDGYYDRLLPYLSSEVSKVRPDICIAGHFPNDDSIHIDSRHLGLVMPQEADNTRRIISKAAALMEQHCDIGKIIEIANGAGDIGGSGPEYKRESRSEVKMPHSAAAPVIAVARDEAFCFYYRQNIALIEDMGAVIRYFSPLHDRCIPDADALLIGGGYPELYLDTLGSNTSMLESVRRAIESGMPSVAECGGFMYLHGCIRDRDDKPYPMAGVIDGECIYSGHLVNFGYVMISGYNKGVKNPSAGDDADERQSLLAGMRGHEFHYYESTADAGDMMLTKASTGIRYPAMLAGANHLWGFPHLYYPSRPEAVAQFVRSIGE